jgi:hypothetical protein
LIPYGGFVVVVVVFAVVDDAWLAGLSVCLASTIEDDPVPGTLASADDGAATTSSFFVVELMVLSLAPPAAECEGEHKSKLADFVWRVGRKRWSYEGWPHCP